jgi:hypothetical protein
METTELSVWEYMIKIDQSLHLIPRLRVGGAILLLPPYVFTACTGAGTLYLQVTYQDGLCIQSVKFCPLPPSK